MRYDEICGYCPCDGYCPAMCILLQGVNGRSACRERILSEIRPHLEPQRSYNDICAEQIEDAQARDHIRLEEIRGIRDMRRRLLYAGALVGIPQAALATICNISQSMISQMLRGLR